MAKNTIWQTVIERMTTQERNDAQDGDTAIIFNTDSGGYQGFNGSAWVDLDGNAESGSYFRLQER